MWRRYGATLGRISKTLPNGSVLFIGKQTAQVLVGDDVPVLIALSGSRPLRHAERTKP
jgi:hypothetical protein